MHRERLARTVEVEARDGLVHSKSPGHALRYRGADAVACAHSDEWPQNPDPSRVSKRPR